MKFKLYIIYYLIVFYIRRDHRRSFEQIQDLKKKRFNKLKKRLRQIPFYKNLKINIQHLEDLPIMDKKSFMENFDLMNSAAITKQDALNLAFEAESSRDFSKTLNGITVGLSTGTSGNKGIFLANNKERAIWVAAMIQRVIGFSFRKRKIAFFLRANSKLYESVNSSLLNFNFFDLLDDHDQNFKRLLSINPDILIAQPSELLKLAKSFSNQSITPNIKQVISVAEVLDPKDRVFLETVFGLKIKEVYQCTEGFLAYSCQCGKLHFNDDFLIIEKDYIDKENNRYHPIITDLFRHTQAIVRYRLDDILMEGETCNCNNHFELIHQIEGRADDIIKLPNTENIIVDIYPDYFRRTIVSSSDLISNYSLRQTHKNTLEISLELSVEKEKEKVEKLVLENIVTLLLKFDVKNTTLMCKSLNGHEVGTKLRRIRNEYYTKS